MEIRKNNFKNSIVSIVCVGLQDDYPIRKGCQMVLLCSFGLEMNTNHPFYTFKKNAKTWLLRDRYVSTDCTVNVLYFFLLILLYTYDACFYSCSFLGWL